MNGKETKNQRLLLGWIPEAMSDVYMAPIRLLVTFVLDLARAVLEFCKLFGSLLGCVIWGTAYLLGGVAFLLLDVVDSLERLLGPKKQPLGAPAVESAVAIPMPSQDLNFETKAWEFGARLSQKLMSSIRVSQSKLQPNIARYDIDTRQIVYNDGTPAAVPPGESPDVIPSDYKTRFGRKAAEAWKATQSWRQDVRLYQRLCQKAPAASYPLLFHGHSKEGFPVVYEQPGHVDVSTFFATHTADDVVQLFLYRLEYMRNVLSQQSGGSGCVYVLDFDKMGLPHIGGEMCNSKLAALNLIAAHYPCFIRYIVVVGAPSWFKPAARMCPYHEKLGSALHILKRGREDELQEFIEYNEIPAEYGGPIGLGLHDYEVVFRRFAFSTTEGMKPTVSKEYSTTTLHGEQDFSSSTVTAASTIPTEVVCSPKRRRYRLKWKRRGLLLVPGIKKKD